MTKLLTIVAATLLLATTAMHAQAVINCHQVLSFPQVAVQGGGLAPQCNATCPHITPPLCTNAGRLDSFTPVTPRGPVGDYTNVNCSDRTTFPTVTKNGTTYYKCVQKCQNVRAPLCVDYNSELF